MKSLGIIPARYGSTRFEGKPLAKIDGFPMIEWVYRRSLKSKLDRVIVATDDKRILNAVLDFGGEAMLTGKDHKTGTDRINEVAKKFKDYKIILNIQGDEPLIYPEMINDLLDGMNESKVLMGSLKHKINSKKDIENPNIVKVITDKNGNALYFSRSQIPYNRGNEDIDYYKHIGIYGYKRKFLLNYNKMEPTKLEKSESLEQLRVLENGYDIKMIESEYEVIGVDTPEDLHEVKRIIKQQDISLK
ncbi:MAG: 3-deoxy-manno-octulosonate cytidylyltransferase [Fusobacteriota bacterium]